MDDIERRLLDMARELKHIDPTALPTLEADPKYLTAQVALWIRLMEPLNG